MVLKIIIFYLLAQFVVAKTEELDLIKKYKFSPELVGTVFSPYCRNKNETTGHYPNWSVKTYSEEEVKNMLKLVSTKFSQISTYGVGASSSTVNWNEGDGIGKTAVAAAKLNLENGKKVISVLLGIWRNFDTSLEDPLLKRETENAFKSSKIANEMFNGTVQGLIFSSLFVINEETANAAINLINVYKNRAMKDNLKIGVQTEHCSDVVTHLPPEIDNKLVQANPEEILLKSKTPYLRSLLGHLDFIICKMFPFPTIINKPVEDAANEMGKKFTKVSEDLKRINSKLRIIWETGWPSQGLSDNGSKNTGKNLRNYWVLLSKWAEKNNITVIFHEAFDQPWKISSNDTSASNGANGANSHYGFWKRVNDSDISINAYEEKEIEADEETENENERKSSIYIAIAILCIMLPAVFYLSFRLYKAQKTIQKLSEEDIREFKYGILENPTPSENEDYEALCVPYDKSFEIEKYKFSIDKTQILGQGCFGTVYKGILIESNEEIAIKVPNKNSDGDYLKGMLKEIKLMIYIGHHKNVVSIKGAYTSKIREGTIMILCEFCEFGSLEKHLRSIPEENISIENALINLSAKNGTIQSSYINISDIKEKQQEEISFIPNLIKWTHEISNGMVYLGNKNVIHADLAVRNVLLTSEKIAKITDFGLSRRLYEYTEYVKSKQEPMPWRSLSPESLKTLSFTEKSDVWSFGITMWEIFSLGNVPYPGLSWSMNFLEQIENGLRLSQPKYASDDIYKIMQSCWELLPSKRPTFENLEESLEKFRIKDKESILI